MYMKILEIIVILSVVSKFITQEFSNGSCEVFKLCEKENVSECFIILVLETKVLLSTLQSSFKSIDIGMCFFFPLVGHMNSFKNLL